MLELHRQFFADAGRGGYGLEFQMVVPHVERAAGTRAMPQRGHVPAALAV